MRTLIAGSAALIAAALGSAPIIGMIGAFFTKVLVGLAPLFQLLGLA